MKLRINLIPVVFASFFIPALVMAGSAPTKEQCESVLANPESAPADLLAACNKEYVTVVVTATRTEKELGKVPASMAVVQKKELERKTASGVAEVLRDVPGVEISDSGQAGQKRISIRGEDPRRVAILIDGQEFIDARDVGTPVLIAPEMIERIEVLRGPASVLYGSKAIGGVVNIITKKGGDRPVQAVVSSSFDSSTRGTEGYGSVFGSSEGFDYRVSGSLAHHNDRDTPEGQLDNTSFENDSWSGYFGKTLGEHHFAYSYDDYNSESDVYVDPAVATAPPFTGFAIDVPQRDRDKHGVFYDWKPEDAGIVHKVHLDSYYQESKRQFNTFSDTLIDAGFPIVTNTAIFTGSELDTVGTNAQVDLGNPDSVLVSLGGQYIGDDLEQLRHREVVVSDVPKPDEDVADDASLTTFAAFAQADWKIADDFQLAGGIREYWVESELDDTTRTGLETDSQSDSELIGSGSFSYTGISDTTLWVRVAQGYVYPSLTETQTGAFAGPSFVSPNRDLDPERSVSSDIGGRYQSDGLTFDTSFFYARAKDYVDHVLCTSTDALCVQPATTRDRVYVNINEARSFGAELMASYDVEGIVPYSQWTWLRRKFETDEYETFDTATPTFYTRTGVRYETELVEEITAWVDVFARASTDSEERESATESVEKAGWGTFNTAVGADFGKERGVSLSVEVFNIFDKSYTPARENLVAPGAGALVKVVGRL